MWKAPLLFVLFLVGHSAMAQERSFHGNGRVSATRYAEGQDMERFVTYHESGKVKEMGSYLQGRKHGRWQQFAEDGTVLAEARFERGRRVGVWEFRSPDGAALGRLYFTSEGHMLKGEQFGEDGPVVAQRYY